MLEESHPPLAAVIVFVVGQAFGDRSHLDDA